MQHLKVKLKGGGPWGFRLQGGAGTGLPLMVSKIRRKSKAYNNLKEGDLFLCINGVSCNNLTYDQVMAIAEKGGAELLLELERRESKIESSTTGFKAKTSANSLRQQNSLLLANSTMKISETQQMVTSKNEVSFQDSMNFTTDPTPISEDTLPTSQTQVKKIHDTEITTTTITSDTTSEDRKQVNEETKASTKESDTLVKLTDNAKADEKGIENLKENVFDTYETMVAKTELEERANKNAQSDKSAIDTPLDIPASEGHVQNKLKTEDVCATEIKSEIYEVHKIEQTELSAMTVNDFVDKTNNETHIKETTTTDTSQGDTPLPPLDKDILSLSPATEVHSSSDMHSVIRKKKMFSSSSFYEEPQAIYPTVEEQFEMAKKIAESLTDDTNKKTKGANMFYKRAKRSTKWIHEGPEPSDESTPQTPDIMQGISSPELQKENQKKPLKLKLVLDPRHPVDLESLRSTGQNISEHNVISPDICHELVRGLESPVGKGSALFAKRKKKSAEWVVDEEKVKALMKAQEMELNQMKQNIQVQKSNSYKPLWNNTPTSPIVSCDPDRLAETVIKAADYKRADSVQSFHEEQMLETCRSPIIPATPAATYYDIYKARAPKGWCSSTSQALNSSSNNVRCSSPIPSQFTSDTAHLPQTELKGYSTFPRKYNFQNFNTVPRKWKPQCYYH